MATCSLMQHQAALASIELLKLLVFKLKQSTILLSGSIIAAGAGTDMDIENRINKARAAYGMLSVVWRNNNFSTSLKLRLFKSNELSVLLYGCCTWKVSKAVTSRLQVFINRCLRSIFRIYWPNRITNEKLLRRTEIEGRNGLGFATTCAKMKTV